MTRTKLKPKWYILILILSVIGIYIGSAIKEYALKYSLSINEYDYEFVETIDLTKEQKINDFQNLWEIIYESVPEICDYEKLYNISYSDKKKAYEKQILESKNDLEYYFYLSSFLNDIPSNHTKMMPLNYKYISEYVSYNYENVLYSDNLKGYTEYWYNLWENQVKLINKDDYIIFSYVDGKYVYNAMHSGNFSDKYMFAEIVSIDGININLAVKDIFSSTKLKYDHINDKPYRNYLVFNVEDGQRHTIECKTPEGDVFYNDIYTDICSEYSIIYRSMFEENIPSKSQHYTIDLDTENEVTYVRINDFSNAYGIELYRDIIQSVEKNGNKIILDMRNNTGGTVEYGKQFLYPALFNEDIERNDIAYMICSNNNQKVYKDPILKRIYAFEKAPKNIFDDEKRYIQSEITHLYKGNSDKKNYVYILISPNTISAADNFVSVAKTLDNVTVIGTNTGGEGIMNSFYMDILFESKLVYIYNSSRAVNPDGTSNAVYGTSPDIYSELSIEGYIKQQQLIESGEDPYTYENRLKWDNVLIETLEIIKESK